MNGSDTNYVSPSSYGGNDDSNGNIIKESGSVQSDIAYGGFNYPFVSASVLRDSATNVAILVLINRLMVFRACV